MTETSKFRPDVAKLFEPRPPLKYVEHLDIDPAKRCNVRITPVAEYLAALQEYKETEHPKTVVEETPQLKEQRLKKLKQMKNKEKMDEDYENWDPEKDPQIKGDPYRTLFVGRLDYELTEIDLQKEFAKYGVIERVRVVRDQETGKSRGYAFVLFERESAAKAAYKEANGTKLGNRTILTDIERGRTVKTFLPRRLGGGLGGRHYTVRQKQREEQAAKRRFEGPPSTGTRGGRGGSFRGRGRGDRGGSRFEARSSGSYRPPVQHRQEPPRVSYSSRSERYESSDKGDAIGYSSRSKREGRDFQDRERDQERDSRVLSEREQERERFKEKKVAEAQRERMRY